MFWWVLMTNIRMSMCLVFIQTSLAISAVELTQIDKQKRTDTHTHTLHTHTHTHAPTHIHTHTHKHTLKHTHTHTHTFDKTQLCTQTDASEPGRGTWGTCPSWVFGEGYSYCGAPMVID